MLSSEEEEQSNNPMGQEAEDGGPFQFRRSNTSQYHKVLLTFLVNLYNVTRLFKLFFDSFTAAHPQNWKLALDIET